jgi:hypothetical protein
MKIAVVAGIFIGTRGAHGRPGRAPGQAPRQGLVIGKTKSR